MAEITVTIDVEAFTGWSCVNCGEHHADVDENPLYECGDCGDTFTRDDNGGHRCATCNKFAAKIADRACPSCNGALEESTDDVYVCPYCGGNDDDIYNADDLAEHIRDQHLG